MTLSRTIWVPLLLASIAPVCGDDRPDSSPFRGQIVFFGSSDGRSQLIHKMNPDGTELKTVLTLNDSIFSGRVSPDGRRLAYSVNPKGTRRLEVWLLDSDNVPRKLSDKGAVTAWSLDGEKIVCSSSIGERSWESFELVIATHGIRPLATPRSDLLDDWSPDGKRLALVALNVGKVFEHATKGTYPLRQIELMNIDGSERHIVTPETSYDAIWPRFSPDGTRIAHYQRRYPNQQDPPHELVVVRKLDGSDAKDVIRFNELGDKEFRMRPLGAPCWSPDGKSLVCCATRESRDRKLPWTFELIFVSLETSTIRRQPLSRKEIQFWGNIDWR